jgi:hypothetical protein
MASTRLIVGFTTAFALVASSALAQSPAQKANALNDQGKALMKAKPMRAAEATEKFRAAIVLSPEGRFYLNLCMSLYQEGKLGEALPACRGVKDNGAEAAQVQQANNIIEQFIVPQMRAAGIDPNAGTGTTGTGDTGNGTTGTGDTGNGTTGTGDTGTGTTGTGTTGTGTTGTGDTGNGTTGTGDTGTGTTGTGTTGTGTAANNFTVAPPPSLFAQTAAAPMHEYTWTLGGQLLFTQGNFGTKGLFKQGGPALRVIGDYALSRNRQFGAQGYLTFQNRDSIDTSDILTVFDIGVGVYKELCKGRACFKPLAGVDLALLSVDNGDSYGVFGFRGELGLEYALGSRYENVITAGVGINVYLPAQDQMDSTTAPSIYGFDKGSTSGYFGIGYTRRFNSPLGNSPLFTMH